MAKETEVVIADPLATARLYLQLNPNREENRALRKLLQALVNFDGVLQENEALLFQGELGQLTVALLDARVAGRYAVEEWQSAISVSNSPGALLRTNPRTGAANQLGSKK